MGYFFGLWADTFGFTGGAADSALATFGSPNDDIVLGVFTGDTGLPTSITSSGELDAYYDAVLAKLDEIDANGVNIGGEFRTLRAVGGWGNDIFDLTAHNGAVIDARQGNDRLTMANVVADDALSGGKGDDTISGGLGDDSIFGGRGRDLIRLGGSGDVDGGEGFDRLQLADGGGVINAVDGTYSLTAGGSGGFSGFEAFHGGDGGDYIRLGPLGHIAIGGGGGDLLVGDTKQELMEGGEGDDQVYASLSDDTLRGGAGFDTLNCRQLDNSVTIDLHLLAAQATGGADIDVITGFEAVVGSGYDDTITGGDGPDSLSGGNRADRLFGSAGGDTLSGGRSDDQITGGLGADVLTGDEGRDTYFFESLADSAPHGGADLFTNLQDRDVIDVGAIDADAVTGGDQAFTIVHGGLTGVAGQLSIRFDTGERSTVFEFDVDGDGLADMAIVAAGDHRHFDSFVL